MVIIRKLSPTDIPKIVSLVLDGDEYSSLEEAWLNEGDWCCTELLKERYKVFLNFGEVFVYEEDGEILGFIELLPTKTYEKTIYLEYIEVKKRERRKGIGRKLVNFVCEYYGKLGYKRIIAVPGKDVVGFYERIGFRKWRVFEVYEVEPKVSERPSAEVQKIKRKDILGKEILSKVDLVSEHVLMFQEIRMSFYMENKKMFGYLNRKPFAITFFRDKANVFVWDVEILEDVIKLVGKDYKALLTVWKGFELSLENLKKVGEDIYVIREVLGNGR